MAKQKKPIIETVEFYRVEGRNQTEDFLLAAVKDYLTGQEQTDLGKSECNAVTPDESARSNDTQAGAKNIP